MLHNGRGWDEFLIPYKQTVDELKVKFRGLRQELKTRDNYSPIEFVVGRVKTVSSILAKADRLNIPLSQVGKKMEDIAGIRIMCQFVHDIQTVVEMIRLRDGKDIRILQEKDYVRNRKESGYRSYHIILHYPVQTSQGEQEILAEIQIRTLAMNFWATIEHSLNYKYGKNIPPDIKQRLQKAAEAAYHLDQEMSQIREEITEAQKLFDDKSSVISAIMRDIEEIYLQGRVVEASSFQEQFQRLTANGDINQLHQLSWMIRDRLRYLKELSTPTESGDLTSS